MAWRRMDETSARISSYIFAIKEPNVEVIASDCRGERMATDNIQQCSRRKCDRQALVTFDLRGFEYAFCEGIGEKIE